MEQEPTSPEVEIKKIEFQKFKLKVNLFKWSIVSVALVLISMFIDYTFKDRSEGLLEIQQYDKYVTDLIVLNKEPGQKRMLAQFFAKVTPSVKLRDCWNAYYKEVDAEYKKDIEYILVSDSLTKIEYYKSLAELYSLRDDDKKTSIKKGEIKQLEHQFDLNNKKMHPEVNMPVTTSKMDYDLALDWERKGFDFLLSKDVDNAIVAFTNSNNAYYQFHQAYEISSYLKSNKEALNDQKSDKWPLIFTRIANDFDWKMPNDIKNKLLGKN